MALFCDSDDSALNKEKEALKVAGIELFDWTNGAYLEKAIIENLPFNALVEVLELAVRLQAERKDCDESVAEKAMWDSVSSYFGKDCPRRLEVGTDSAQLRIAISSASKSQEWFKRQDKAEMLGGIVFENYSAIPKENELKIKMDSLSRWIDNA